MSTSSVASPPPSPAAAGHHTPPAREPEGSAARWVIAGLSVFVCAAVAAVLFMSQPAGSLGAVPEPTLLAKINVALNASAGVLLVAGYGLIRTRRPRAHRAAMLGAFALSSTFLVTYLLHHAQVGSVPFRGEGWIRSIYFAILVPHILLAAGIVPLALLTLYRGWTNRLELHRRVARWTLPLWLYVSGSGVAVYLLLYSVS